ncbi:MAG: HEPN domain-containing protein [Clostridia bacterium]|nr:HEPN domain-containing protein [Clostridia bacterium]
MTIEERRDLSKARFDRACDCLHTAKVNREISDYRAAANRSYYAIFHSMRAVLALEEVDMSKHSGVMAEFRKRYLKTEILDRKLSAIITQAFEVRNASDYDDFYIVAKEDVDLQIDNAAQFMRAISDYLIAQGVAVTFGGIKGAEA